VQSERFSAISWSTGSS